VEQAVGVLEEQGYIDDARYARLFAEDKRTLEHWGAERIRQALAARGVSSELIDRALSPDVGERELDRALALLARRFPGAPPRERRERDRALGMLLRKGYDAELAFDALAAYAGHTPDPTAR
jgi:regulatory protein